jgi:hypothetical protein
MKQEPTDPKAKMFLGCFFSVLILLTSIVLFRQFFILGPLLLAWVAYVQWKNKTLPPEEPKDT